VKLVEEISIEKDQFVKEHGNQTYFLNMFSCVSCWLKLI